MAFQRTGSQEALRASATDEQLKQHQTVYQPSRGGHFPVEEKPVPGTPQNGPRTS